MPYRVYLKKNEEKRILAGHPWVYANEAARIEGKDVNGSVAEVLSCLNEQMSVIPVCHRNGLVIYSDKISSGLSPVPDDPFNGLENCTVTNS